MQDFYRQEIAEYAAVLQLRPDHFWSYFNWANCQLELGNLYDALVGYTACIRIRPDFPWPYNNRGTVHLRLGENDRAAQDYSKALELNDDYADAHANRGMAYFRLGKSEAALADLYRALAINPDYAGAYEYRADVRHGLKEYDAALADYARLLELTPEKERWSIYFKRSSLQSDRGRTDLAVDDCTHALALNPNNPQAFYKRAGFHMVRKEHQPRGKITAPFWPWCPEPGAPHRPCKSESQISQRFRRFAGGLAANGAVLSDQVRSLMSAWARFTWAAASSMMRSRRSTRPSN